MWLHPIIPKHDELLSSWLLRLSRAHCLKPHTFCDIVWPKICIWNRDIDVSAGEKIFQVLEDSTLASLATAQSTCLKSYEGLITEYIPTKTKSKWLTSIGVLHRTHKRHGQMFCPHCLKEDEYYKKAWRLTITTECTKHGMQLLDRCQICKLPIVPKRVELDSTLSKCFNCRSPLCNQHQRQSSREDLRRQRLFEIIIKHGWFQYRDRQIYSMAYFKLIDKLLWLVCRRQSRKILYHNELLDILPTGSWELPYLDVDHRRIILNRLWYFLKNYPEEIVNFVKSQKIPWSSIQGDFKIWPYFTEIDLHHPLTRDLSASSKSKCQL